MAFYLWISEGEDGANTSPVLATSDPEIIRRVLTVFRERITDRPRAVGEITPNRPEAA